MIRRPPLFLSAILIWLVLESVVFALAVFLVGWLGALALGVMTTLVGAGILRNIGAGATRHIQATLSGGNVPQGAMLDGVLTAVGAILLILPGFVSDIVGLALAAPSLRQWLARRLMGRQGAKKAGESSVIDLNPGDWSNSEISPVPGRRNVPRANL